MNRLIEIGFKLAGHWKLDGGYPVYDLTSHAETPNVLYSFVSSGEVKYIGKITQSLGKRMYGYQNPGPTQSTNIKNNSKIKEVLISGKTVDIYILPDTGLLRYGRFHINLAAGLEDSLVADLSPPWNGKSIKIESQDSQDNKSRERTVERIIDKPDRLSAGIIRTERHNTTFQFQLYKTYYNQGFFNVPIVYTNLFGRHQDRIKIYCGKNQDLIQGTINRSANQNGTPRIMGGMQLCRWFRENFKSNDTVNVEVLSPTSILLRHNSEKVVEV